MHSSFTVWSLMCNMPVFRRSPRAMARPTLGEITAAARPYSVWLARATASSSLLKVLMFTTGPKTSSSKARMPAFRPESTVGLKNRPSAVPPASSLAPALTESCTMARARATCLALIIGPKATWPLAGSPTGMWVALPTRRSIRPAATFSCTSTRPEAMQIWPWCSQAPQATLLAARSRSASSSTISALLPPSSSETFFRCLPQSSPMRWPTAVEPVNWIIFTSGAVTSASPAPGPPGSIWNTPAGTPASSNTRAMITPPAAAVCGSGFSTTALPAARAGATARSDRMSGKLNGEITPTTPCGTRRA